MIEINKLKQELTIMPEHQLKKVAITDYGLLAKEIKKLTTNQLIQNIVAIEYMNAYK